jgi:hypothetical protein
MGSRNGTHRCPIGDCPAQIPGGRLMCPRHWRLVPPNLKRSLRRTGRDGDGAGSRTQQAAVRACLDAVQATCEPACDQNLRQMVRRFLAGYRHPNHINGESWDEEDITRLIRVMRCHPHKPDPRTRRCRRCGVTVGA